MMSGVHTVGYRHLALDAFDLDLLESLHHVKVGLLYWVEVRGTVRTVWTNFDPVNQAHVAIEGIARATLNEWHLEELLAQKAEQTLVCFTDDLIFGHQGHG